MRKNTAFWAGCLVIWMTFFSPPLGFTQEDKAVQLAIATVKSQMNLPKDVEIKFVEKRESAIANFLSVKLILFAPDREIPLVVYVEKGLDKVIIGNLFIRGENVTRKEAGEPKPRKIDMGLLEIEQSPFRGPARAKVTIVEFSNFECPYCVKSWAKMRELLGKYPQDIKYVFKHFPLQRQGKSFNLSVMASAAGQVNQEAFWLIHDFLFTEEGQTLAKNGTDPLRKKIEQIFAQKGVDLRAFQNAVEGGEGKKRVEEDIALGNRIRVRGTPTGILNGTFIIAPLTDKMLAEHLMK